MTRDETRRIVIESLHETMGTDDVKSIDDDMDPASDLGLDSHDGVDFACHLSSKLGFHFPDKRNPFRDNPSQPYRKVGEIVDFIQKLIAREGVGNGRK